MPQNDATTPPSQNSAPAASANPGGGTQHGAAVLLVAHGSRRAEANAELGRLAELIRRSPDLLATGVSLVETAYLEIAEPSIPEGIARCVARGAGEILIMPFFLSPGRHVVEDLEAFRQQAAADYPRIPVRICGHLGLHPLIIEIVLDRIREAQSES